MKGLGRLKLEQKTQFLATVFLIAEDSWLWPTVEAPSLEMLKQEVKGNLPGCCSGD